MSQHSAPLFDPSGEERLTFINNIPINAHPLNENTKKFSALPADDPNKDFLNSLSEHSNAVVRAYTFAMVGNKVHPTIAYTAFFVAPDVLVLPTRLAFPKFNVPDEPKLRHFFISPKIRNALTYEMEFIDVNAIKDILMPLEHIRLPERPAPRPNPELPGQDVVVNQFSFFRAPVDFKLNRAFLLPELTQIIPGEVAATVQIHSKPTQAFVTKHQPLFNRPLALAEVDLALCPGQISASIGKIEQVGNSVVAFDNSVGPGSEGAPGILKGRKGLTFSFIHIGTTQVDPKFYDEKYHNYGWIPTTVNDFVRNWKIFVIPSFPPMAEWTAEQHEAWDRMFALCK